MNTSRFPLSRAPARALSSVSRWCNLAVLSVTAAALLLAAGCVSPGSDAGAAPKPEIKPTTHKE